MIRVRALVVVLSLLAAACGGSSVGDEPVVRVDGPEEPAGAPDARPLESPPTPVPTPTPTPEPTPPPLAAPAGARMEAQAGSQEGAVGSFCWTERPGGSGACFDHPPPSQEESLTVRSGEAVLLVIEADRAPDEQSIRPFQGQRQGHPSQQISPALQTDLTINLPPGEWEMDLCSTWRGHGQPICWLFEMEVVEATDERGSEREQ